MKTLLGLGPLAKKLPAADEIQPDELQAGLDDEPPPGSEVASS